MSTNINSTEQIVEINAGDQITNVNIVSQSTTQVISGEQVVTVDVNAGTIPAAWGSITGTLSNQTDLQNALNAKQNNITLTTTGTTGVATLVGATLNIPNYVSSTKQTEWDSAYNDKINSAEVSGTTTKTLTLTQQDGGIIQASWSDFDTAPVTSVFGRTGDVVATEGDYNINQLGDVTITSATNGQVLKYNGTAWVNAADASGLTSVGLAMPSAFTVSGSPLTSNGTITVTGAGTTSQYVRGDGSLAAFPSVSNEAKTLIREVYNKTGATLTKGTVIYIDGGQGNLPTVTKAIATGDPTSAQTFGIVQSDITNMNNGFVVVAGGIDNLDTQAYTEGTALYLSPTTAGAWTSTKPYAPDHMVYLGVVVRSHPTQGVIEVKIQNGVELDEIHDVSARFPVNKDGLFYNSTSGVWENKSIAGVLGYTPVPETRIITINGTAQNLSADRTWSVGTVTSVAASGGTGISIAGSPVTGSGTITITNTAPDQVVGLTGAGTTSISGTYPNFTITSNDQYTGTVTSVAASGGTGISISGSPVTGSGTINITNTAPDQIVSLTGAGTTSISGTYPNFTVTSNDQYVGTVTSVNATVPIGFEVSGVPITSSGTVDIKFASGYSLPTNAKQTQWDDAYAKRINTLTVTGNSGSATLTSNVLNVPTYTLTGLGGEPAITAGTTSQYWRGDKSFQTLDTSVVPENGNVYFTEPRVRATVLSGLNITGGSISASDSVLNAFGKVQNQINGLIGGSIFQSTWNASTNTPTLASGVGTKGYYYIVSVAGTTNLDGITDWQIGDWAIFDGTVWRKVDNTDAVVSVNGYTGVVNLVLDDLADVSAASPTDTQLLRFNGTTSKWYNWTPTFEPALTKGNLTEATSSVLTITGGSNAVIGSGTTIEVKSASAAQNGVVTTGTQTFAGNKTFNGTIYGASVLLSGNLRTGGSTSNIVKTNAGAETTTFNTIIADNTAHRTVFFRGTSSSPASTWYGGLDSNGDNIPYGAIDAMSTGGLSFWSNPGAVGGGNFSLIAEINPNGLKLTKLDALGSAATSFLVNDSGVIKTRTAAQVRSDIGAQSQLTNPVTGTGTNNYITKFNATGSSIANSQIFDNGTNIGINTNTPNYNLEIFPGLTSAVLKLGSWLILQNVVENQTMFSRNAAYDTSAGTGWRNINTGGSTAIRMYDDLGDASIAFHLHTSETAGTTLTGWDGSDIKMVIRNGGNVGINTVNPNVKLDVYDTTSSVTNDPGNSQIRASASNKKWLSIGYDATVNAGYLQSAESTVDWRPIILNYNGGNASPVLIGQTTSSGTHKLQVTGSAIFTGTITSSNFSGSSSGTNTGDQTNITGNSGTTTALQTARNFTINGSAKSFDGTANISWTAAEIGLTNYLPLSGGTMTGSIGINNAASAWDSGTQNVLQIRNAGIYGYSDYEAGITANAYYNNNAWKRIVSQEASMIILNEEIGFRITATSTANSAITWTTPLNLQINAATFNVATNFSSSIKVDGYLTGQGTNPGGLGGSRYVIDHFSGNMRIFSYGDNTSTNGGFVFNSQRSDGTNSINVLSISSSGNSTFYNNIYLNPTSAVTSSNSKIIQIGDNGIIQNVVGTQMMVSNNAYYSGSGWLRITSAPASAIRFGSSVGGDISFHSTGTGSAGSSITNWDSTDIKLYIKPSGEVGIGTVTPTYNLDVYPGTSDATFRIGSYTILENVVSNQSMFSNNAQYAAGWKYINTGSAAAIRMYSSSINFHIAASGTAGSTITNWDSSDIKMTLLSSGSLGLGTTDTTELGQKRLVVARDTTYPGDVTAAQLSLCGATTPAKQLVIGYDTNSNGYGFIAAGNRGVAWTYLALQPTSGNVVVGKTTNDTGKLQVNGSVYATSFFESSDIRLKNVIDKNPKVKLNIDVLKYTRKDNEENDKVRFGYSAQQIKELMPELVGGKDYLSVNYIDVHTLKIASLEEEIKELKNKLNELVR